MLAFINSVLNIGTITKKSNYNNYIQLENSETCAEEVCVVPNRTKLSRTFSVEESVDFV